MAKAKELFNVKGVDLTQHEKSVYDVLERENRPLDYKEVARLANISEKSSCATLARLEKTHGLLRKNEPVKVTTYEVASVESE